jgi:pimeloyl-ACP methyl ester carboxylesterase
MKPGASLPSRRRFRFFLGVTVILGSACASCSDLQLARYRDDRFLADYHYALGEQYIKIDGLKLCYQESGQGDAVVILPGLGTSIDFWQLNIPALAERYHVIAVDPPGFGKSDKPDVPYDLEWICEKVLAFLDAKHVPRASFIGGSMGGHLGLLLALNHPDRVDKLVVMGSSGIWPQPGILLDLALKTLWRDSIVADHMRRNWPSIFSKMFRRQTPVTRTLFRYQMAVRADGARYAPEGRASSRALRSIFYSSCRDRLHLIEKPVLLIWGESDHVHPPHNAILFRERLPDSRLVVVPDAAHEVMVDQPETFNRLVSTFLQEGTAGVSDHFAER